MKGKHYEVDLWSADWWVAEYDEAGQLLRRIGPFPRRRAAENSAKARNEGWETDHDDNH